MSRRVVLIPLLLLSGLAAVLVAADWWICMPAGSVADYVGSQECRRCHEKEMDLWKGSDHDLSMQPATPDTVLGNFDDRQFTHVAFKQLVRLSDEDLQTVLGQTRDAPWAIALHGAVEEVKQKILAGMPEDDQTRVETEMENRVIVRPCDEATARDEILQVVDRLCSEGRIEADFAVTSKLFRRGDKFFATTDGPTGKIETFEIKYVFGYWPLQQYLVEFPDGRMQCLPMAFNTQKHYWFHLYPNEIIPAGDELHWTRRSQNWNHMCAECHSTNLVKNYDLKTNTFNTTWSEIDVNCETCHGPGSLHVELADSNGLFWDRRYGYGLPRLKDPDWRVEIETCAPCHARRRIVYPNLRQAKPLPSGAAQKLLDYYVPELFDRHYYYADGQVLEEDYVYSSFIQSKMYEKGVRCTDCHDPHSMRVKSTDQHAPRGEPIDNRLCTGCHVNQHPAGKYDTPAHHFHPDSSKPGTRCVECHMPETTYMVVDPRRDHSMRSPRPDLTISLGIPNACNLCHNDKSKGETPQWAVEKIEQWYGRKKEPLHFAHPIAAGRAGNLEAQKPLEALTRRKDVRPAIRATGLLLLGPFRTPAGLDAARKGLKDADPLIRLAAVRSYQSLLTDDLQRVRNVADLMRQLDQIERMTDRREQARRIGQLGLSRDQIVRLAAMSDPLAAAPAIRRAYGELAAMLADPLRAVRSEAAWVLSYFPPQAVTKEDRPAFDAALAEYMAGQQSTGDQPTAQMNMALVEDNLGRTDKAVEHYLAAIRIDPTFVQARVNLATLYGRIGKRARSEQRFKEAIGLLQKMRRDAVEQMRDPADVGQLLGRVHYSLGLLLAEDPKTLPQAVEQLAEAVRLSPREPRMHYNYGLALQRLGRPEEAEKQFLAACELQPGVIEYLHAMRILHMQQQQWSKAAAAVEKLLRLQPRNSQLRELLYRLKRQAKEETPEPDSKPQS